jgi:hypothetical protein
MRGSAIMTLGDSEDPTTDNKHVRKATARMKTFFVQSLDGFAVRANQGADRRNRSGNCELQKVLKRKLTALNS